MSMEETNYDVVLTVLDPLSNTGKSTNSEFCLVCILQALDTSYSEIEKIDVIKHFLLLVKKILIRLDVRSRGSEDDSRFFLARTRLLETAK
jgi:hypothetical protein